MKFTKYTKEQLIIAVKNSLSYREVLGKLKVLQSGGNYTTIRKYVKKLNLDISHFKGKAHAKGTTKRPLRDYTSNNFPIQSFRLKNRLLKDDVKQHKCENCGRKTWLGKPIPIELHHKDGNPENNALNNLQILCSNCHSLTTNFCRKNKRAISELN